MNTSRVPGVTRNSGWEAVSSEIDHARALRQQQSETTSSTPEPQLAEADERGLGDEGGGEHQGRA
jgi:hypothetical protein